jgi:hypothetical protein
MHQRVIMMDIIYLEENQIDLNPIYNLVYKPLHLTMMHTSASTVSSRQQLETHCCLVILADAIGFTMPANSPGLFSGLRLTHPIMQGV